MSRFKLKAREDAKKYLIASTKADLQKTANALINKNLVPEHTLSYFKDPNMLQAATINYINEPIKEYKCPNCQISVRCPKAWIIQHVKQCTKAHPYFEKRKDNELLEGKLQPYFY